MAKKHGEGTPKLKASKPAAPPQAEAAVLHFPVKVSALPPKGLRLELKTDARERAALAAAHDVRAVAAFAAAFHISPWKKQGVRVEGQIEAEIEQLCSVSAEPLRRPLRKSFTAYFVPAHSRLAKLPDARSDADGALLLDPEGEDAPEIFSGSEIDAGALAEEFFELEIDRYPRKEGVILAEIAPQGKLGGAEGKAAQASGKDEGKISPFAALAKLKKG